jgi:alpha-beta hydrolase superfamily lysophospholipase
VRSPHGRDARRPYAIRYPEQLSGVVFNSGALAVNRAFPWFKRAAARVLGRVVPTLGVGALQHARHMARGDAAQARYLDDPSIHHGGINAGTGSR